MADTQALSVVALLGAIIASRFISESGLKLLSVQEKAVVVDAFSGYRKYSLLVLLLLVSPALLIPGLVPRPLFTTVICGFLLVLMVASHRKLTGLGVTPAYTRRYLISQLVIASGVGCYFLL